MIRGVLFGSLLLALGCGAGKTAMDAAGAMSDLTKADREWENYENKKAQEARQAFEEGLKMHGDYMAMKPPEGAGQAQASAWYQQQSRLLGVIDERFNPVWHSMFHEKIMIVESRMGEAWEKLALELAALHGDLSGNEERDNLVAELNQTLLNASTYYGRVANDYTTEHPAVVQRNAELVALAKTKHTALEAQRAALPK